MPKKLTTEEFIVKSRKVHGDKYDYSLVDYKNSYKKVIIICSKHGEFNQSPNAHLSSKNGCPICAGNSRMNNESFIMKSKKVHGDKYNYSNVCYKSSKIKVDIICRKHGIFSQRPCDHINQKHGCPKCIGLGRDTLDFINDSKERHSDKYDYSKTIYVKYNESVDITCPVHGDFKQKPYIHLMGSGCQKCSESKGERKISLFLNKKNVNFETQKIFKDCINPKTKRHLKFDFYLLDYNVCIEYDGEYHYEPWRLYFNKNLAKEKFEELKKRDNIKTDYCRNNNIKLLRIPYFNIKEIDKIISNYLFKKD